MTLKNFLNMTTETKLLITIDDPDEYFIRDYLGDWDKFTTACGKVKEYGSRQVKWFHYNKAVGCIEINCK